MKQIFLKKPDGTLVELIRVVAVGDPLEDEVPGTRCGDCGAKMGEYHMLYCDLQRCPICGGQLLSCDHADLPIYSPRHTGKGVKA